MANLREQSSPFPRLLVSVRNLTEAQLATTAEVDLIDLKEPHLGSLGMVEMSVAQQVASTFPKATLSLALGELSDWKSSTAIPRIPLPFQFVKLGLSQQSLNQNWREEWQTLRHRIDGQAEKKFDWIAVIYADHQMARAPAPEEILPAAVETGCAGVLFDTWSKTAGTLLDHLSLDSLVSYRETIRAAGMLMALAGSVRKEHLPTMLPLGADVIAVRGAVCKQDDRTAEISSAKIRDFQDQLHFVPQSP